MTTNVSRPETTDCIASSCPSRNDDHPNACFAVRRSTAGELGSLGTAGAYPGLASGNAFRPTMTRAASAVSVGEHAMELVGLGPSGSPRRDTVAKCFGFCEVGEERRAPAKAVAVVTVHAHVIRSTRSHLARERQLPDRHSSVAPAISSGFPMPSILSAHARRQDWHHHVPCVSFNGRRSSSPQ
jgi:hypothetical protein